MVDKPCELDGLGLLIAELPILGPHNDLLAANLTSNLGKRSVKGGITDTEQRAYH